MSNKIIVAGSILVDRIQTIDAYPHAGELVQIRGMNRVAGGLVPNTGRDLKLLDPSLSVLAVGKIGDDADGAFVREELAAGGLELALSVSKTEATSFTNVMSVPGGERTFFTYPGASASWGYADFPFDRVNPGDIVLLGYFLLLAQVDAGDGVKILRELKRRGAKTAIDLVTENSDRYALVRACLPYVDNLIVNEIEAARLVGHEGPSCALAKELLDLGVNERVVIHEPTKGTSVRKDGTCAVLPSFRLSEGFIKDKTGAGDAYCAGALTGIFRGLSDAEILRRGRLAAAGALSSCGATAGVRDLAALETMCEGLDA
jgi:sugar/nucleoside kinase (ribokinase family)